MQYCTANDIDDTTDKLAKKGRALLFTTLMEGTYHVVTDLAYPRALHTIDYSCWLGILDTHSQYKKGTFTGKVTFSVKQSSGPGRFDQLSGASAKLSTVL